MRKAEIVFLSLLLTFAGLSPAEELSALRKDIQAFKSDPRGPYQAVRWFCPDGSVIPPQDRCSEPGGIQHALPKSRVKEIAETHHHALSPRLNTSSLPWHITCLFETRSER